MTTPPSSSRSTRSRRETSRFRSALETPRCCRSREASRRAFQPPPPPARRAAARATPGGGLPGPPEGGRGGGPPHPAEGSPALPVHASSGRLDRALDEVVWGPRPGQLDRHPESAVVVREAIDERAEL